MQAVDLAELSPDEGGSAGGGVPRGARTEAQQLGTAVNNTRIQQTGRLTPEVWYDGFAVGCE